MANNKKSKKQDQSSQTMQDELLKILLDFTSEDNLDSSHTNQDDFLKTQVDFTSEDNLDSSHTNQDDFLKTQVDFTSEYNLDSSHTNQDDFLKTQVDFTSEDNLDSSHTNQDDFLKTQVDFTSEYNWDAFYTLKESADELDEWSAGWLELQALLVENLLYELSELEKPITERMCEKSSEDVKILVPGCGNSKLSEHLYDLGFLNITNVDISEVAILDMMNGNVRERPEMKWLIMDMTDLKFPSESFDAVVDKGELDVLMSSKIRPRLGCLYLSQVKRVLTAGGKFICLTLAESHVLDLLFHKFRFGWKMSLHMLHRQPYSINPDLQSFVVVVQKDCPASVFDISSSLDEYSVESHGDQAHDFHEALEKERKFRVEIFNNNDALYSLEDLRLGAKGNISVMVPGRRIKLILGEPGVSHFSYNCVLLDAKNAEPFFLPYVVMIVPQEKAKTSYYSAEEEQWVLSGNLMIARLLLVLLDSSNSIFSMRDVEEDINHLVKELTPANYDYPNEILFLHTRYGIKQQETVHQVTSDLTGPIVVEDVIYQAKDEEGNDVNHRRLIFQRAENLVQSKALISTKGSIRRRKNTKQNPSSRWEVEIFRHHLAVPYHRGVLAGILLLSSHFSDGPRVFLTKTLVIGLGGGVLPMFLRKNIPYIKIKVVEVDPVVLDIARQYFGFKEDDLLEAQIGDGIEFLKEIADSEPGTKFSTQFDIIIVDVDSSGSRDGLSCPEESYVEESFFWTAREAMFEPGLLFMNLVSRSSCLKQGVYSMMKKVFMHVFRLKIEGDENEVVVGVKHDPREVKEELSKTCEALISESHWPKTVIDHLCKIEQLS